MLVGINKWFRLEQSVFTRERSVREFEHRQSGGHSATKNFEIRNDFRWKVNWTGADFLLSEAFFFHENKSALAATRKTKREHFRSVILPAKKSVKRRREKNVFTAKREKNQQFYGYHCLSLILQALTTKTDMCRKYKLLTFSEY